MGEQTTGASGNKTIIGKTIVIKGELSGDEDLVVEGKVEGQINLKKALFIEPSGETKADINTQTIRISGRVIGNVSATDKIEIAADGRMQGDVKAPRVIIADGARFKGQIDMDVAS